MQLGAVRAMRCCCSRTGEHWVAKTSMTSTAETFEEWWQESASTQQGDAVRAQSPHHRAHLLKNVPVRIMAAAHDTSISMIEKHYSVDIHEHSDAPDALGIVASFAIHRLG